MKSPVVIKLNGTTITGRIDGIESFEITIRENNEQGVIAKSYSSELTFYDDGYSILKPVLIDNINGPVNEVDVQVFDECCGRLVFDGVIRGDSIDWCEPECWISAQIVEKKPALNCVKSRLIWDSESTGFLNRPVKNVRYCVDIRPDFLLPIYMVIYAILNLWLYSLMIPLSLALAPASVIVFLLCNIICAVSPGCTIADDCVGSAWVNPVNVITGLTDLMNDLNNRLIQCQWYHPTAFVRDYIKNVCDVCGLTFESSILNDPASPYYNLLLFSAPVRKGYKPSETQNTLITENIPNETLDTLMNQHLKPLFNGEYWIVGNRLIFERKDYFTGSGTWIDAEQMLADGRIIDNRICFSWIDRPRPAFGEYQYSPDGSDLIGNEAFERFNEIVEWNSPPSDAQSESLNRVFTSSMARFRGDEAGPDGYRFVENNLVLNLLFGNAIPNSRNLLLLSQHTPFNYKFLIWDESSPDANSLIKRNYSSAYTGGTVYGTQWNPFDGVTENAALNPNTLFNYPMWFNEYNDGNLYTNFHYIDNPRLPGTRLFNFSFSFGFDCGEFDAIDFSKDVRIRMGSNVKFGEIQEIKIDFVKRTIAVSGIV